MKIEIEIDENDKELLGQLIQLSPLSKDEYSSTLFKWAIRYAKLMQHSGA